jgi:hypothetical protein
MSEPRTAYDELTPAQQMTEDCRAVERELGLPHTVARPRLEQAAQAAVAGDVPSLHFEDFPREVGKREIRISDAAARLANALHLHLD